VPGGHVRQVAQPGGEVDFQGAVGTEPDGLVAEGLPRFAVGAEGVAGCSPAVAPFGSAEMRLFEVEPAAQEPLAPTGDVHAAGSDVPLQAGTLASEHPETTALHGVLARRAVAEVEVPGLAALGLGQLALGPHGLLALCDAQDGERELPGDGVRRL